MKKKKIRRKRRRGKINCGENCLRRRRGYQDAEEEKLKMVNESYYFNVKLKRKRRGQVS